MPAALPSPIAVTIADDSLLSRKNVRKALPSDWPVVITEACNGEEALAAVSRGQADLLFLDLTMPVLDGFGVLQQLQQQGSNTTVIVISADIQPQAQALVHQLGAAAFLTKPLQATELAQTLTTLDLL